jgi:MFS transporter, DHA1 family, multidrug resistance protein
MEEKLLFLSKRNDIRKNFTRDMMKKTDRKIFCTLFFALFATITGVGIVVPLLPVYAHDLGAGGLYIALIFSAFSLSRTCFLPYFGRASDKKGRKPFIIAGLLAYAFISLAFILSQNIETLIAIRFVQGIASAMIMPVTQAYVGDITPAGTEGFSMGIFNISVFFGLSIGPLAGGFINDHYSLNAAFGCMGLLAFIAFAFALLFLPPTSHEHAKSRDRIPATWNVLLKDRNVSGLIFFRFAYTACIGIIWSFLPVFAESEFSLNSSSIGILVMLGVFISGLLQTPMGYLADRFSRKTMGVFGGLLTCYAILSLGWAQGFNDMFLANVLFGLGGGISMPAVTALAVAEGNKADSMGSVMGLFTMGHSLGMLAGSMAAGLMMDLFNLRHAFFLGSATMLLGIIVFVVQLRTVTVEKIENIADTEKL